MNYTDRAIHRNITLSALFVVVLACLWDIGHLFVEAQRLQVFASSIPLQFDMGPVGTYLIDSFYHNRIFFVTVSAWSWVAWAALAVLAVTIVGVSKRPSLALFCALGFATVTMAYDPAAFIAKEFIVANTSEKVYDGWLAVDRIEVERKSAIKAQDIASLRSGRDGPRLADGGLVIYALFESDGVPDIAYTALALACLAHIVVMARVGAWTGGRDASFPQGSRSGAGRGHRGAESS